MINYYCSCSYSWKHWRTSKISYCYHHHRLFPFLISNSNLLVCGICFAAVKFGLYSPYSMSWVMDAHLFVLPGWLCTISFSENRALPSCIIRHLKEGWSLHRNAQQLLGPDPCALIRHQDIHALRCEFRPVQPRAKPEHHDRQSSPHRVPGDRRLRQVHHVVLPWPVPMTTTPLVFVILPHTKPIAHITEYWPGKEN